MSFYRADHQTDHSLSDQASVAVAHFNRSKGRSESSLSLFQSLDEFSSTVAPHKQPAYQCLPSHPVAFDRIHAHDNCFSDIWSQDTTSSQECWNQSWVNTNQSPATLGPSDYKHFLTVSYPTTDDRSLFPPFRRPAPARTATDRSVVLCLSSLIP